MLNLLTKARSVRIMPFAISNFKGGESIYDVFRFC